MLWSVDLGDVHCSFLTERLLKILLMFSFYFVRIHTLQLNALQSLFSFCHSSLQEVSPLRQFVRNHERPILLNSRAKENLFENIYKVASPQLCCQFSCSGDLKGRFSVLLPIR